MSGPVAESLSELLGIEKAKYLDECKQTGGTASGFRERIRKQYTKDPPKFNKLALDAWLEATTKKWQQQPRRRGPDLFSINGYAVPEFLTRVGQGGPVDGQAIENDTEEAFEKVSAKFATVNDLYQDATIGMRKAAQNSASAERKMQAADEARRRAKGKVTAFLKDLADAA
jgi:hypothetical protein